MILLLTEAIAHIHHDVFTVGGFDDPFHDRFMPGSLENGLIKGFLVFLPDAVGVQISRFGHVTLTYRSVAISLLAMTKDTVIIVIGLGLLDVFLVCRREFHLSGLNFFFAKGYGILRRLIQFSFISFQGGVVSHPGAGKQQRYNDACHNDP